MNKLLSDLDNKLISSLDESPLGLASGKMGFCLYFFVVSRMERNENYEKIAYRLIDEIFEKAPTLPSVDVRFGLAGLGLGICYLIKEKFVKGNINTVLADIDDKIFKELSSTAYYEIVDSRTLIHLLYYWPVRLKEQKEGSETQWLYQELVIYLLNKLYEKVDSSFCETSIVYTTNYLVPPFLYVLSLLYRLNFYNYRIQKLVAEFSLQLFSTQPLLHANKLYLLWGLGAVRSVMTIKSLDNYIRLIRSKLKVDSILSDELRAKNVFFNNGLTSIYFLLTQLTDYFGGEELLNMKDRIRVKMESSNIWELLNENSSYFGTYKGLYNGYCGVALLKRIIQ
jgi:hypothetical protein